VLAALAIQRETGAQFPFGMRIGINSDIAHAHNAPSPRRHAEIMKAPNIDIGANIVQSG
jgi:hypothetical protein